MLESPGIRILSFTSTKVATGFPPKLNTCKYSCQSPLEGLLTSYPELFFEGIYFQILRDAPLHSQLAYTQWSHPERYQKARNTGSKYAQGLHSWSYDPRGGRSRPTSRCLNLQIPLQNRAPLSLETEGTFYSVCFSENLLPGCFGLFYLTALSFSSF